MQLSTLTVILAAQLGLAGYLWYQNNQQSEPVPLLAQAEVNSLTVIKGPGKLPPSPTKAENDAANQADTTSQFSLERQQQQWRFNVGSSEQPLWLAANPAKVQQLLTDLQKARLNWPLADSQDSLARFTLSETAYQWQLQITAANGQQQKLWLGDSAGFRQQYIRRDGENAVYQVALNSYELSTDPNQWLDKTLLALQDIQAVRGTDFALSKGSANQPDQPGTPDDWQLSGLAPVQLTANATLNSAAAQQLLNNLQTLTVQQYQPQLSEEATEALQRASTLIISTGKTGTTEEFSLQLAKAGEQYLVRRSDIAAVFSLDQTQYDNLISVNLAKLQQTAVSEVAAQPAPAGPLHQLQPGQTASIAPSDRASAKASEVSAKGGSAHSGNSEAKGPNSQPD